MIWLSRLATVLVALFIAKLSLSPMVEGDPGLLKRLVEFLSTVLFDTAGYADKVAHFIAYGTLGAAAGFGFAVSLSRPRGLQSVAEVVLFVTTYGIVIEVCQALFTSGRMFDRLDILTNFAACVYGVLLADLVRGQTGDDRP